MAKPLGRRAPSDWRHVERYPYSAVAPRTVETVERFLPLPGWHATHDQGLEGSCVGHGVAMERSITNYAQAKSAGETRVSRRYNPLDVWNEAKRIDEWDDTNPGDDNGTSVRAGYEITRTLGLRRVTSMRMEGSRPVPYREGERDANEGVATYRWAQSVDEMRTAIADGLPVTIGVTWYANFDRPQQPYGSEWYIGVGSLGIARGGHCVCLYAASDRRDAFKMKNSWGREYPLVWLPYETMDRLLRDWGEAALVTDR